MITEALQSQIDSLRHQIDLVSKVHAADQKNASNTLEKKIEAAYREKEISLTNQNSKLSDLQRNLNEERERCAKLRIELHETQLANDQELANLKDKLRRLKIDIQNSNEELNSSLKPQLNSIKDEEYKISVSHKSYLDSINTQTLQRVESLKHQSTGILQNIQNFQLQKEDLKRRLAIREQCSQKDVEVLNEAIKSSQNVVDLQEMSIKRLRYAIDEATNERDDLDREQKMIEDRERALRSENLSLRETIERLERMIYGKKTIRKD